MTASRPAPSSTSPARLIRAIGFWGLSAAILNGMIGAGIFALPGSVGHFAGGWTPLIILAVALALLPVVAVFALLAALFEDSGGPILYVRAAFGTTAAFQTGWMQSLSTVASAAANANLLADYVLRLAPAHYADGVWHAGLVLAATVLVLMINLVEARQSAAWLKRVSVAKLLPLAMLVLIAVPALFRAAPHPAGEWSAAQAALLAVYALIGFEGALSIAGDARDPRRDFPRALICVFLVVACLYALIAWGYVATTYQPGAIDKAPLASMAFLLLGVAGTTLLVVTAALSIFGNVIITMLCVSRRLLALAEMGALPAWFGAIRPVTGLPRNSVLVSFAIIAALALSGGFVWLAILSVASRLLVYLACIAALPIVRAQRGMPLTAPLVALIVAALATCIALVSQSEVKAWIGIAITIAVGFAVQALARAGAARAMVSLPRR